MLRDDRGITDNCLESANPNTGTDHARPTISETRWVRLKIAAELLEDAHPGSGLGGGGLDALIARDSMNRPVIWASHLKGLLRDTAYYLYGKMVAQELFGRRGGKRQSFVFTSLYATADPQSRVWRSSARDSFDNRAPREDTLRAIEYVPAGTRFEGLVEAPTTEADRLRRLLQEVEAIGHGRASGAGRVRFALSETAPVRREVGNHDERLILLLRNVDPLCITATATPGNPVPSFAFIPGRTLLGALAAWLIDEGDREAASLLVGGHVSVSDALPLPPREPGGPLFDVEVLPAPLSLVSEKPVAEDGRLPWWSLPPRTLRRWDAYEVDRGGKKRPEERLFVYRENRHSPWETYRPFVRVRLRNGRPEGPGQADPSLFAVEQIAEKTLFLCELRSGLEHMKRLASGLQPLLEGCRWLRVGRGSAPVEVARLEWTDPPQPTDVSTDHAYLILTSDLLVRDDNLLWQTALDEEEFRQLPDWPSGLTVKPVVQDTVPVHGFNGTSRLWRRPAAAVRRGSVFRIEGNPDQIAVLTRWAAEGRWLGERTHEGFGHFRIDQALPGVSAELYPDDRTMFPAGGMPDDSAEKIAAITRQWFEAHPNLANTESASVRRPSLSQWQELVADLEREAAGGKPVDALPSRLQPLTAGKRVWTNPDAQAILQLLNELPSITARAEHARLFVRWLRANMQKQKEKRKP